MLVFKGADEHCYLLLPLLDDLLFGLNLPLYFIYRFLLLKQQLLQFLGPTLFVLVFLLLKDLGLL